jgi:hypothetical protein
MILFLRGRGDRPIVIRRLHAGQSLPPLLPSELCLPRPFFGADKVVVSAGDASTRQQPQHRLLAVAFIVTIAVVDIKRPLHCLAKLSDRPNTIMMMIVSSTSSSWWCGRNGAPAIGRFTDRGTIAVRIWLESVIIFYHRSRIGLASRFVTPS